MKMPENIRVWVVGGVAIALIVVVAAWFGLIGPELSTVPAQHAEAASAASANTALQTKVTELRAESADMGAFVEQLAVAREELPIQADLPTYIVQLGRQAELAGVAMTNLSIGAVSVSTGATTTAAGSTDSGTTDSGTTDSDSTTSTPAATTTTDSSAATAVVAAGPAGELFQIQITMTTSGTFRHQQGFLTELQNPGSRAALITSAELAPAAAAATSPSANTDAAESTSKAALSIDGESDLSTVLDIFVAPQTPAAAAELSKQLASRTTR